MTIDRAVGATGPDRIADLPVRDEGQVLRVLIAGVGNLLRGDDAFGVEVARLLLAHPPQLPGAAPTIIETGIGGMHLVQELMSGYDALIILDAVERGAAPGTLFLLEPERVDPAGWPAEVRRDFFADTHYAEPSHALALAAAVGALPPRVLVVGCQVASVDDLLQGMTPAVARAVEQVAGRLPGIVGGWLAEGAGAAAPAPAVVE
jgi:hydrogenase maturation protease